MNKIVKFFKKNHARFIYHLRYLREKFKYGKPRPFDKRDENLLIVGNGPSAGRIDFSYYKDNGFSLMCVNDFALKEDMFFSLKPKYYCCIDDLMYSPKELENNENVKKVFENLNKVDWDMVFLCRNNQNPPLNNPHIKIVKTNVSVLTNSFEKYTFKKYLKNKACPDFQNVICCCVFFAICSKFNEVMLTGVEFDMHKELIVEKNNDVYREYRHFYGVHKVNITEEGQIKKGEIYKYFYFSYLTLYQYKLLSEFAQKAGVKVTNLTINSTIDSFPKEDPVEIKK